MRQAAQTADAAEFADDALALGLFLTDEGNAEQGNVAALHGLDREQRMVDGAKRGACAQYKRQFPARKDVDEKRVVVDGHHQPAGAFAHHRSLAGRRGKKRVVVDRDAVKPRGVMRRDGCIENIPLRQYPLGSKTTQIHHAKRVCAVFMACLHRLPVIGAQRIRESRTKNRFADIGVGAADDKARAHAFSACASSLSAASMDSTSAPVTFSVSEMRSRAVPAGTVGGRMPRLLFL